MIHHHLPTLLTAHTSHIHPPHTSHKTSNFNCCTPPTMIARFYLFTLLLAVVAFSSTSAFVSNGTPSPRSAVSGLNVFGPKQALAIERRKNPQAFESTIQGLMKTKNLSRAQAEQRYGEFLLDPDGFALKAAAAERKEAGYKDWIEQAVAKSDDPEATRERIENFTKTNRLKGTAIMAIGSAALLAYSASNPYVPPGV